MPKVSIVMPAFNRAQTFLPQAIESVLAQSFQDFELIIVDDHSHDNTQEVALSYAKNDPRVKVFRNEENLKLPKTLNEGFSHATGDYWTWISDDNEFTPDAIAVMLDVLEKDESIAIVCMDQYTAIDEHGKITEEITAHRVNELGYGHCTGPCFLYRRTSAEVVGGYDPDLFCGEDYDYYCRLALAGRMVSVPGSGMRFRFHKNHLTVTHRHLVVRNFQIITAKYSKALKEKYPAVDDIRILGVPLLSIHKQNLEQRGKKITQWKLFNILTILSIHQRREKISYRLFGFISIFYRGKNFGARQS